MSNIKIDNHSGSDLFVDSESFLQELDDHESINIFGGISVEAEAAWSTHSIECPGKVTPTEFSTISVWCRTEEN